jgi:pimeloyl-ACP methyl ester carboxylesterase
MWCRPFTGYTSGPTGDSTSSALLPPGAPGAGEQGVYLGAGGRELAFRKVEASPCRHRLLYLHGIESHGAWFLPAAYRLRDEGCSTYLLDRRGSGLNERESTAPSPRTLLEDIRRFREHLGDPEIHLVGLSWGGKLAFAAALDRPSRLRSLVLIVPGLRSRLSLTPAQKLHFLFDLVFRGGRRVFPLPIRPEMFTRSPAYLDYIRRDPLRVTEASGRFLLTSLRLDRMVSRGAHRLAVSTLLVLAGRDRIVDNEAVESLLQAVQEKVVLRKRMFADATHSLQFDEVEPLTEEIRCFLEEVGS